MLEFVICDLWTWFHSAIAFRPFYWEHGRGSDTNTHSGRHKVSGTNQPLTNWEGCKGATWTNLGPWETLMAKWWRTGPATAGPAIATATATGPATYVTHFTHVTRFTPRYLEVSGKSEIYHKCAIFFTYAHVATYIVKKIYLLRK